MRIAVASGKGGTGKTLVSTSLVHFWSQRGHRVTYVDADAEEPNGHLFLKPKVTSKTRIKTRVPALKARSCAGNGRCQEVCAFNAILSAKGNVIVFNELCHSCSACVLACPDQSLVEKEREIGTLYVGKAGDAHFVSGSLDVGEARVSPLIQQIINKVADTTGIVVVDSPPGTSCSVIAACRSADLLLLVTEPTPFGMHDLELAVGMGRALGLKLGTIINRADLGDARVKNYLKDQGVPVLAEIPFDRAIAESYAAGRVPLESCESIQSEIAKLSSSLLSIRGVK